MASREKVIKWLESVHGLDMKKRVLLEEYRKVRVEAEHERELDMRNIPDACRVGGRTNDISKPTENKAIACIYYSEDADEIKEKLEEIRDDIKTIKHKVDEIYNDGKSEMRPEDYYALTKYYFYYWSIKEIMADTHYQEGTIKMQKSRAIDVLAKQLPENIY